MLFRIKSSLCGILRRQIGLSALAVHFQMDLIRFEKTRLAARRLPRVGNYHG